jgi:hypothetical protein
MRSQATVDPSLDYGVIVDGGELQVWHSRVTGPTAINVRGNVEAGAAWVHDSLITANDPQGGTAITASSGLEVTNVTVRRSTLASVVKDNPHALTLHHYAGAAPTTATLDSVLVEPGLALRAQGAGATIAATRSWMAQPTAVDGANVPASGSGAFRSGDPKVDADLRPLPGSPLIDGGMSLGGIETDVDGRDRNSDGDGDGVRTPDIGAHEAAHIETSAPSGAGAGTAQATAAPAPAAPAAVTPVVPAADRVAPVLRGSRLLKPAFTARKGTRLRFTLTEAGRVGVRVDRLVRIGGRTRVRPAGATTLAGKAGANDVAFRGRLAARRCGRAATA